MKFLHRLGLATSLALAFLGSPLLAQRAITLSVAGNQMTGNGTVRATLTSVGNELTVLFSVHFSPGVLRYDGMTFVSDSPGALGLVDDSQVALGNLGIIVAQPGMTFSAGSRPLVDLRFTVLSAAGSTAVAFGTSPFTLSISAVDDNSNAAALNGAVFSATPAPSAPAFSSPTNATVTLNTPASFQVTATGTPAPTFAITGGSNPSVIGVTLSSSGLLSGTPFSANGSPFTFTITAANIIGSATQSFTLTIGVPPTLASQPGSTSVAVGQPASFAVAATGTPPLAYQWLHDGIDLPGATGATLAFAAAAKLDAGNYAVRVANAHGTITSNGAALAVTGAVAPPELTKAAYISNDIGAPTGAGPRTVGSGQFLGERLTLIRPTRILGAKAEFTQGGGSFFAVLVALPSADALPNGPSALNRGFDAGQIVAGTTFSISAPTTVVVPFAYDAPAGSYALVFGSGIFGATGSGGFTPYATGTGLGGIYWVGPPPSGPYGWIGAPPTIIPVPRWKISLIADGTPTFTSADNATFTAGSAQSFTVVATSAGDTPTFAITAGNLPSWATLNALTGVISGTPPNAAGSPFTFTISATNSVASVSQVFTLAVTIPITLTAITSPRQVVTVGQGLALGVTASGATSYQWQRNGVAIPGATGATYTVPNATARDAGWYRVVLANVTRSLASAVIFVNIAVPAAQIVAWGDNSQDQTNVPTNLGPLSAITAGANFNYALKSDGTLVHWGFSSLGRLLPPGGLNNVVAVSAGTSHALALKADGTLVAWGDASGNGETDVPPGLAGVVAIGTGGNLSVALKADGTVVAWGWNAHGQATVPAGLNNVTTISTGSAHTLALKADGTVVAWGYNGSGENSVPAGLNGIVGVASGANHSVALRPNGTLVAWGAANNGALDIPAGLAGIVAVAAADHNLALKADGTVVAWGYNSVGQATVPSGLIGVVAVSCSTSHSLALRNPNANVAPVIATHPSAQTVAAGATATFTVVATGTPTPTYQWRHGGANLPGATNATLTLANVQPANAGAYDVVVSNLGGTVTSAAAALVVNFAPVLTTAPAARTVVAGRNVTFAVLAAGQPAPLYQWYKGTAVLTGATNPSYTIAAVTPTDAGSYSVTVTNTLGTVTSGAEALTVIVPPTITTQPLATTVNAGATAVLTVAATGTPAPVYRWRKGSTPLAGASLATLTLANAQPADAGAYAVSVSNAAGTVLSAAATLTINPSGAAPVIVTQPADQYARTGQSATFSVAATGNALGYQWRKDTTDLPGATTATLTRANLAATDAAGYSVVVTNTAGSATSRTAALSVIPAGFAVTHALATSGYEAGGTVQITTTIAYSGTLTALAYQALPPPGFAFLASDSADVKPAPGTVDLLEWAWSAVPTSPVTLNYTLAVPAGTTGAPTLTGLAIARPGPILVVASPDPLPLNPTTRHSADTDGDGRLSLLELARVIELFNTRSGAVRTGCYALAPAASEDGFAPDATRAAAATVPLARYHAADTDRDGKLSLLELTRLIELFNYRTGTQRTGQYHVKAGTEDGFDPGP
ncbi:MAG: hypothetical protein RLZZ15_4326 [Verrucomicrobiota bacterium]